MKVLKDWARLALFVIIMTIVIALTLVGILLLIDLLVFGGQLIPTSLIVWSNNSH